jgi:O-antigen ligase
MKIKQLDRFGFFLLSVFPLSLIAGNLFINAFIFLFSVNFFLNFKENKIILKNQIFYLMIFFFISLIINVIFSTDPLNSLPRVVKILLIIFFIFEIKRLIQNYKSSYIKYIFFHGLVYFFVLLDIIFELIFGHNMIGNTSYMPGRIASFFGDELVVGAFYHGFVLFFLSYCFLELKPRNNILIFLILGTLLISFLIGERTNFIKSFISIILFVSLAIKINFKKKIAGLTLVLALIFAFIYFNPDYKLRFVDQLKPLFSINGYSNFLKETQYGAHRNASVKIFKENLYFGVGIKNFRNESSKKKYENKEYKKTDLRQSTHPHQIHHEFLSETGLFGYISFLLFIFFSLWLGIKNYLKEKNLYQLSSIIFIMMTLMPILTSGSFLSTFTSGIFWLNYAIMISFIQKNKVS